MKILPVTVGCPRDFDLLVMSVRSQRQLGEPRLLPRVVISEGAQPLTAEQIATLEAMGARVVKLPAELDPRAYNGTLVELAAMAAATAESGADWMLRVDSDTVLLPAAGRRITATLAGAGADALVGRFQEPPVATQKLGVWGWAGGWCMAIGAAVLRRMAEPDAEAHETARDELTADGLGHVDDVVLSYLARRFGGATHQVSWPEGFESTDPEADLLTGRTAAAVAHLGADWQRIGEAPCNGRRHLPAALRDAGCYRWARDTTEPDRIPATWCQSENVGDRLTGWLVHQITGRRPTWVDPNDGDVRKLVGAGSLLNWAQPGDVVWGAGLANHTDHVHAGCDIRAVRGPLSRVIALCDGVPPSRCPERYGDPGLLLPRWLPRAAQRHPGRIGLVPHYADARLAAWRYGHCDRVHLIDPLTTVEAFVAEVTACDLLLSSSLHGLVVADAYDVPNAWVSLSAAVGGDGTKFRDHLLAVGRRRDASGPIDCRRRDLPFESAAELVDRYRNEAKPAAIAALAEGLWQACPIREGVLT